MKKKIVLVSILLTLAVLVSMNCTAKRNVVSTNEGFIENSWGTEIAEDFAGPVRDADISSAIKNQFSNDELISSSNINVDTTNGSVTLNGKVSSQAKADRAMYLGRSVEGVKRIQSNLIVH